jgi:hypothetical protein
MLTLEQIREALKDRRPQMVAKITGLHPNTIRDIRDGRNTNPCYRVVYRLSEYLDRGESCQI